MHDFANREKIDLKKIEDAQKRISGFIKKTPLEKSDFYSEIIGGEVFLKMENLQLTNSFKIRGAFNKMLKLTDEERKRGVVAISSGNHGHGISYISKLLNVKATIFVPENALKNKIEKIRKYGAELLITGKNYRSAEIKAREFENKTGRVFISPYNDCDVIAGAGTVGLEILNEKSDIDIIITPVGGGGLMSGVAIAAKSINPKIKIIGVQSEASPVLHNSLKAGKIIEMEVKESLADGLHDIIEPGSITFDLIKEHADGILLVNEDEIMNAIKIFLEKHNCLIEGSSAVGVAALSRYKDLFRGKKVAVVISGGNFDIERLK